MHLLNRIGFRGVMHVVAAVCCGFVIAGFSCDTPMMSGGGDNAMDADGPQDVSDANDNQNGNGDQDANVGEGNVACCLSNGCRIMDLLDCAEADGMIVDGEASCDPDPCGMGACCSNGGCVLTTSEACEANYEGDGTTCNSGPCLFGACCLEEDFGLGPCFDEKRDDCEELPGTWLGFDTKCEPTKPCGGDPDLGACCSTGGECELTDHATCVLSDRCYAGDGVDCTSGRCATGACCRQNDCLDTVRFGCVDDFKGNGTRCATVDCADEYGACCYDGGKCIDIEEDICGPAFDGTYLGDGTTCLPNDPCDEPLGACCVDGVCQQLRKTSCAATQGEYHGDDANCTDDADICDQILFEITSVDYQNTVQANTDGTAMTITWSGILNFPVEVRYRLVEGGACPLDICGTFMETFDEEANPIIMANSPACVNFGDTSDLPAAFPYEVVIVDSINRESNAFPAPLDR